VSLLKNIFFLLGMHFPLTASDSHDKAIGMMSLSQVQRRIAQVQRQLLALGPLHPGSISEQHNVCGQPGCRCKDPHQPQKHGPYYQLSFTWQGKSSTRFLRPEQVEPMRQKVANYKRLRELMNEWVSLGVELERAEREKEKHTVGH
jgi:hypothetical protein